MEKMTETKSKRILQLISIYVFFSELSPTRRRRPSSTTPSGATFTGSSWTNTSSEQKIEQFYVCVYRMKKIKEWKSLRSPHQKSCFTVRSCATRKIQQAVVIRSPFQTKMRNPISTMLWFWCFQGIGTHVHFMPNKRFKEAFPKCGHIDVRHFFQFSQLKNIFFIYIRCTAK